MMLKMDSVCVCVCVCVCVYVCACMHACVHACMGACVCMYAWYRCVIVNFYYMCRCDCVCGWVGIVLAVNVKQVESRNMSNVYALIDLRSNVLWCFTMFTQVYLYLLPCCVQLSTCPFIVWNMSDPKDCSNVLNLYNIIPLSLYYLNCTSITWISNNTTG